MLSRIIFYKSFCNLLKTERRLILNIFEKNGKNYKENTDYIRQYFRILINKQY